MTGWSSRQRSQKFRPILRTRNHVDLRELLGGVEGIRIAMPSGIADEFVDLVEQFRRPIPLIDKMAISRMRCFAHHP
jgi:hypothetical protein